MKAYRGLLALLLVLPLTGCEVPSGGQEGATQSETDPQFDPAHTVCNPFSDDETAANRGIVGHLKYLEDSQPRYSSIFDYINYAQTVESTLFFNKLHIPTRPFDRGFIAEDGSTITRPNGDTLYEYFALDLRSELKLGVNDSPGLYQLALLSDDGAVISVVTESGDDIIVNNNGTHPTRFGCAEQPVYIGQDQTLPVKIQYFQGPRYHIALTVLWRPWPQDGNWRDSSCGKQGNSTFFDSTQNPPRAKTEYLDMLARGWKVLENENYSLPSNVLRNPCTPDEEPLLQFGISFLDVSNQSARLLWSTNLTSTTSIRLINMSTGVESVFTDSTYLTNHDFTITSLTANTLYSVYITSISPGGQTVTSSQYAFRTRR